MHRPHKARKFNIMQYNAIQIKPETDVEIRSRQISKINIALCYEQTSPLDVYTYAFGFSLFILHYFSKAPNTVVEKCTDRIKQENSI